MDVAKDVDGFRTGVDASLGAAGGITECRAEDGNLDRPLGGSAGAKAGAADAGI